MKKTHFYKLLFIAILIISLLTSCISHQQKKDDFPQPVAFKDIEIDGLLKERALKNFDRLESGRYLPDSMYVVPNAEYHQTEWPGDVPGRLVLALTLLQQATHRTPVHLQRIINDIPKNLNKKGYFGHDYKNMISEQQLSGHGWALRGLCEYYSATKDQQALQLIKTMVDSLVLPTKGQHALYPIDPAQRQGKGGVIGEQQKTIGRWILSSDIGCDFIFLDGVVHAYQILKTDELKQVVDEMVNRYLQVDLVKIKAQTHASLTAMRAILRYYELCKRKELLDAVVKRFQIYKKYGMSDNYENYNWFCRPTWTEPCAVIDSYIIAVNLWRLTGNTDYLADAQKIYYNGISAEQRSNGGFGCNTCTGNHDAVDGKISDPFFKVMIPEAHWCCTMRGGEGLSRAVEYSYFTQDKNIFIPDYHTSKATLRFGDKAITLKQTTSYPFGDTVKLNVINTNLDFTPQINFFVPEWMASPQVFINGIKTNFTKENQFLTLKNPLKTGDVIELTYKMEVKTKPVRKQQTTANYYEYWFGPLMLGIETQQEIFLPETIKFKKENGMNFSIDKSEIKLTPLHHLMDAKVTDDKSFSKQIMFKHK